MQKTKQRGSIDAQAKVRLLVIDFLKNKKGTQQKCSELYGLTLNGVQKIWRKYKAWDTPQEAWCPRW
jgi:hypothetical protein